MNRVLTILIGLVKIAVLVIVFVVIVFYFSFPELCENDFYSETYSPNGEFKAITFERSCGASSGFNTQISILDADENLENEMGNILRMPGHPDEVAPNVVWQSNTELKIYKHINGKEYFAESSYGWLSKIKIHYGAQTADK